MGNSYPPTKVYVGASSQFFGFVREIRNKIFGELFHQMHKAEESEILVHYLYKSVSLMHHAEFLPKTTKF